MRNLLKVFLLVLLFPITGYTNDETKLRAARAASEIEVSMDFSYTNFPLSLKVFEFNEKGRKFQTGRTAVVNSRGELPLGGEITGKTLRLRKGTDRIFAIIVENSTDKDQYFYASYHDTNPMEHTLGNKFFCFCYGQVYKVPAKKTWYRVGLLSIDKNSFGDKLHFRHRIFGMSPEKMREHLRKQQMMSGGR